MLKSVYSIDKKLSVVINWHGDYENIMNYHLARL